MDNWTAILPLAGVVVGWLLNQATARRTERLADQRVIKEMLYALLELHRLLLGFGWMSANLPGLVASFRKQLPVAPPPEYEAAIDELLANMARDGMTSFFGQQLAGLKDDYTAGLAKLAAVDPISAYRLRGQENTLHDVQQLAEAMQAATVARVGDLPISSSDYVAMARQQLEPEGLINTQRVVREVMEQLAVQLDRRTRRGLAVLLARAELDKQEIMKEMQGRMQQIMAAMPQQGG